MNSLIQKKIKEIELDKYNYNVDNMIENYLKSISAGDVSNLKNFRIIKLVLTYF